VLRQFFQKQFSTCAPLLWQGNHFNNLAAFLAVMETQNRFPPDFIAAYTLNTYHSLSQKKCPWRISRDDSITIYKSGMLDQYFHLITQPDLPSAFYPIFAEALRDLTTMTLAISLFYGPGGPSHDKLQGLISDTKGINLSQIVIR
jgi:hypothetical protein